MGLGKYFKFWIHWSFFSSIFLGGKVNPFWGYMFNKEYKRFLGGFPFFPDREDYDDHYTDDDGDPIQSYLSDFDPDEDPDE